MHVRKTTYHDIPGPPSFRVWGTVRGCDGGALCGDVVATRELSAERLAILVADALGSGMARARTSAALGAHVVALLALDLSPAYALRVADRELREGGWHDELPPLASIFAAIVDGPSRRLRYASAAHETALVVGARGEHRHLVPSGPVAGLFCDADYRDV